MRVSDFIEAHCNDCHYEYYVTEYAPQEILHCLQCGGVNVSTYHMGIQDYLDREYGNLHVIEDLKGRQEEVWERIKNMNTDRELDEIEDMLFWGLKR